MLKTFVYYIPELDELIEMSDNENEINRYCEHIVNFHQGIEIFTFFYVGEL